MLDADLRARTRAFLLAAQEPSGAFAWTEPQAPRRAFDPWNHTQCALALIALGARAAARRAMRWLARTQPADGLWLSDFGAALDPDDPDPPEPPRAHDVNFSTYAAVGAWRLRQACGADEAVEACARRALDAACALQAPNGRFPWAAGATDASPAGCASIRMALRCGEKLATAWGDEATRARWACARARLDEALVRFAAGARDDDDAEPRWRADGGYAMDWYYPALVSALPREAARARLEAGWARFVDARGCRCVAHEPWRTAAETAETLIACLVCAMPERARGLIAPLLAMRARHGGWWMGVQTELEIVWPATRNPWTAATVALADEALRGAGPFVGG